MADYYPLIARAVEGLGSSTGEARRALYERARSALVAQLRGVEPPLSESDITKERLALEEAIRKVEAENARRQRSEPRPPAPSLRAGATAALRRERAAAPAAGARPEPPPGPPSPQEIPAAAPAPDMQNEAAPLALHGADDQEPALPLGPAQTNTPAEPARPIPSARNLLLKARTSPPREPVKPLRQIVNQVVNDADELGAATAKAAQSARSTRDSYGGSPLPPAAEDDDAPPLPGRSRRGGPRFNSHDAEMLEPPSLQGLEPDYETEHEALAEPHYGRPLQRPLPADDHYAEPKPPRSYRGLARLAVVLLILAGLVAAVSWQWSNITGLYQFVSNMRARQVSRPAEAPAQPKFSGRVPQEQAPGQQSTAGAQDQNAPAVAQRVVLYEEDQSNPQGKRYAGSVIWRTDTVSPGPGLAPELEVRADITIPDRQMGVTWKLRRNTDPALPASHTIEITFNLPSDFPGGGIANVPGVLLKQSEEARGTPLAGIAVKVTSGFFLIGLNAADADVQRNVALLKDRPWFDIPLVYTNGVRAILAIEKGPPGDRAFADAFAAWNK